MTLDLAERQGDLLDPVAGFCDRQVGEDTIYRRKPHHYGVLGILGSRSDSVQRRPRFSALVRPVS